MIDVKSATNSAVEFVQELYESNDLIDFMLEEVELSEDESRWYITLGFYRSLNALLDHPLNALDRSRYERVYKQVEVDAETGEARAMKIRTV